MVFSWEKNTFYLINNFIRILNYHGFFVDFLFLDILKV